LAPSLTGTNTEAPVWEFNLSAGDPVAQNEALELHLGEESSRHFEYWKQKSLPARVPLAEARPGQDLVKLNEGKFPR
jgi:hypothetical protein